MLDLLIQSYTLDGIGMGPALLVVGMLALLLWASISFRNPSAVVAWGFTILLFVFSGLFGIGIELVWIGVLVTSVLVVVGVVVRWSQ